jgi:HAD superfamily hydrolase (TIGR01549 family)
MPDLPLAATLDLFNTLVFVDRDFDNVRSMTRSLEFLKRAGVHIQSPNEVIMTYRNRVRELVVHRKEKTLIEFSNDAVLEAVLAEMEIAIPDRKLVRRAIDAYFEDSLDHIHLFEGTREVLDLLKQSGVKLGLISNHSWPSNGWAILRKTGTLAFFDSVLFSGDFGYVKPSRKIFDEMTVRLGVTSSQIVHTGDELRADVEGAGEAGYGVIWKAPPNIQLEKPDYPYLLDMISDIRELPAKLAMER